MLNKLKRFPAKKQFEKIEGDFRNVNVSEINELIDGINSELQDIPVAGPLVYLATLSQSGINNPVAEVVRNDFQGDIL